MRRIDMQIDSITALPFGKYEGIPLERVPTSYLHYIIQGFETGFYVEVAVAELDRRHEQW